MSSEKTEALLKVFPDLYTEYNLSPTDSLMCFGFECGNGWFDLLWRLSKKISECKEGVIAIQVKEKYGTLRFYIGGGSDKVFNIIDEAERESKHICEECGDKGELRERGVWLKTVCETCNSGW
jgi:hypothetical protein